MHELVEGDGVRAHLAQYQAPHDPIVLVVGIQSDRLLDLRYGFVHVVFLEQGKGPVPMTVVIYQLAALLEFFFDELGTVCCVQARRYIINVSKINFGFATVVDGLHPLLVHIENEC